MQQRLATNRFEFPSQPVAQILCKFVVPTIAAQDDERVLEEKLKQMMAERERLRNREAELLKEIEGLERARSSKREPGAD